jgi:hypothetical protein
MKENEANQELPAALRGWQTRILAQNRVLARVSLNFTEFRKIVSHLLK